LPDPDAACALITMQATGTPLDLYIAIDKSSSMAGTKWDGATAGLTAFVNDPSSAGIRVALNFFPLDNNPTCNQFDYETPVVPFVHMPYITAEGAGGPPQPGFFGGWLGRSHNPFFVLKDPSAADFNMSELAWPDNVAPSRRTSRVRLAGELDALGTELRGDRRLREMGAFQSKAFDLLAAPATRLAFQIEREHPKTRDGYGRNIYGQSVLLARRLIEAGTRVACISWAPDANATWDTHGNNFKSLKDRLLPQLDAAVSSLLADLNARGMLERTLVVVMGEFGRSPKVNAGAGRDHWNFGYSLLMAGGGIKAGHVHGASDKIGARPQRDPVVPAEIVATIYQCLGIPHDLELHDQLQRPLTVVPHGRPIAEILA
ncbi:MAG: DUF1501 domain-containing protein, partial [Isosphaeraceae bacterium]|nr:DUF1501 domain-containing protein [Isosphaeraceae bacterium]